MLRVVVGLGVRVVVGSDVRVVVGLGVRVVVGSGGGRSILHDTGYVLSGVYLIVKFCGISGPGGGMRSTECHSTCICIDLGST